MDALDFLLDISFLHIRMLCAEMLILLCNLLSYLLVEGILFLLQLIKLVIKRLKPFLS